LEKRVQRGLGIIGPNTRGMMITSKVRFHFEGVWAIEQTVVLDNQHKGKVTAAGMIQFVLATIYYRVLENKKSGDQNDQILAKL